MYLTNKHIHPENFVFPDRHGNGSFAAEGRRYRIETVGTADDVYRVSVTNRSLWPRDVSVSGLTPLAKAALACRGAASSLRLSGSFDLELADSRGRTVLSSLPRMSLGLCGKAWVFVFRQPQRMKFYGMGEKNTSFEKSNRVHKFWNVDAFADHPSQIVLNRQYDPDYVSIPYAIVKQGNTYAGILVDSPYCGVIGTSVKPPAHSRSRGTKGERMFYVGAEDGAPSLYIVYGPSLRELTRKFQLLVGVSQLPPLWALGFQQSRWGYKSRHDLEWLADNFERLKYPVDGLWLDIEYMDGYRVFTFDKRNFPNPAKDIAAVQARGYRVVPIIDPGVKLEAGYKVYDRGHRRDAFCRNPGGREFVGFVWPGRTAFPDFSLPEARAWWAEEVRAFARTGIHAAWLDMNDPSTGVASCTEMLFDRGRLPHDAHHNQYALLMAMASRAGFEKAWPNERIFLLCRSGSTGSQQHTAIWTGDNASNYHHLALGIPKTLNLALSGVPHNGPDVGGFALDSTPQLMIDWTKAGFLFPFFRDHCSRGRRQQEPWAFGPRVLRVMRAYTRLRYKLLPYLYNLFIEHELSGEAILRPLFHDFADTSAQPLEHVDDQFLVGPSIMQAPFVREDEESRGILLPSCGWYRADTGSWMKGARKIRAAKEDATTPLFIREGAIVPMQRGVRTSNRNDLRDIELLLCFRPGGEPRGRYIYRVDDGLTLDYRKGKRSTFDVSVRVKGDALSLTVKSLAQGYGQVAWTPLTVSPFAEVLLNIDGVVRKLRPKVRTGNLFGVKTRLCFWQ